VRNAEDEDHEQDSKTDDPFVVLPLQGGKSSHKEQE
jgi:hypothetical protein